MESLRDEIGRRLKSSREAHDLTLADVCARIPGLTVTRLSNWENGSRLADLDIVKRLAVIYETSAGYLLTLEGSPPDPRAKALLELFNATDSRGKDVIIRVAESESRYVKDGVPRDCAA